MKYIISGIWWVIGGCILTLLWLLIHIIYVIWNFKFWHVSLGLLFDHVDEAVDKFGSVTAK